MQSQLRFCQALRHDCPYSAATFFQSQSQLKSTGAKAPIRSAQPRRTFCLAASTATAQLTSLKEWAPVCSALGKGDQTVLLRKGGIKEPTFKPAASEFLLFPTAFHTDAQLLKPGFADKYAQEVGYDPKAHPQLEFSVLAKVTGGWTTFDPAVLEVLDGLHIWTPEFMESRLKWRERQPITVLELRAFRLSSPLRVPAEESFFGCFSWVPLPQSAAPQGAEGLLMAAAPALSDAAFAVKQEECRRALAKIAVEELQLAA